METRAPDPRPINAPPQDIEAEKAVIGACLINPTIIPSVCQVLDPGDFYREAHGLILSILSELGKQADIIRLRDLARERRQLERLGGEDYLLGLAESVSTSAGWHYHAEIVKKQSRRRKIIIAAHNTLEEAYGLVVGPEEILSLLKEDIRNIEHDDTYKFPDIDALCRALYKNLERQAENKDHYTGLRTGFSNIDKHTLGIEPGTTTYLAARPSIGKTALGLNIARNACQIYPDKDVLFFSHESEPIRLVRRLVSAESKIHVTYLRWGNLDPDEWHALSAGLGSLCEFAKNLRIISHPKFKQVELMTQAIESYAMDRPLSLIIVDHIQRMFTSKRKQNRHLELSWVSEKLTDIAQGLKVPMIIACQLKRIAEDRKDKRPQLGDLKESGDLEQNADSVWGLYRKTREAEDAEVIGLKERDGGVWKTNLHFDQNIQQFSDEPERTEGEPVPDDKEGF